MTNQAPAAQQNETETETRRAENEFQQAYLILKIVKVQVVMVHCQQLPASPRI